jgi:hypothetical protein
MRFVLKLVAATVLVLPTVVLADHMNGRYHGIGDLAGYRLDLQQHGRSISGQIFECDEAAVTVQGQTDGGDYGFGQASDLRNGGWGSFELRWTPEGVILQTVLAGQFYRGQFGHVEQSGACDPEGDPGGDADDADGGMEEEADLGLEEEDQGGQNGAQEQQAGEPDAGAQSQGEEQQTDQGGGPLPNF